MKERGGRLFGGQITEDMIAWAAANRLTETTLRNDGFCVHVTVDTERDNPIFALQLKLVLPSEMCSPIATYLLS